ncbi:MAG TPA: lipid-A-disaccharide synthase-related protein [Candidatus Baltobacteraceae bacterium]
MSAKRVLFVSNGHGEAAIAARIAQDLHERLPNADFDHLALVGDFAQTSEMHDVGPRRPMPSGGLLAMGNVPNIVADVRGGLLGLTVAQWRFLRAARGRYDAVLAVGDTLALMMALTAKAPTYFVGTAKSVYVAPYGPFEERVLRRAAAVFVRDRATAERLTGRGVPATAPGNVIVDLFAVPDDPRADAAFADFAPAIVLFPGSRQEAYGDAVVLLAVVRELALTRPQLGAVVSIAPCLDAARYAREFANAGWTVVPGSDPQPLDLRDGERTIARAWNGSIGPLLRRATLVIGQAGTANEAAAAAGVPVAALELAAARKTQWYRMRQQGLLGSALDLVSGDAHAAAVEIGELLDDVERRTRMGAIGRERMGRPGGAAAVARHVAAALGAGT